MESFRELLITLENFLTSQSNLNRDQLQVQKKEVADSIGIQNYFDKVQCSKLRGQNSKDQANTDIRKERSCALIQKVTIQSGKNWLIGRQVLTVITQQSARPMAFQEKGILLSGLCEQEMPCDRHLTSWAGRALQRLSYFQKPFPFRKL